MKLIFIFFLDVGAQPPGLSFHTPPLKMRFFLGGPVPIQDIIRITYSLEHAFDSLSVDEAFWKLFEKK